MAIFEKSTRTKTIIDDTEKLSCVLENAQQINKHTEYTMKVQRGPLKENKWNVLRRYRDFAGLHRKLEQANIDLPLPPKKLIGNMQPSFIAERQIALQNYINEVLKNNILALSLEVRSFLDPSNYSLAIADQAVQTVSIALRGDGRYELKGPLTQIGWRIRKHYFLVCETEHQTNCMLVWQHYGPDRTLTDSDIQIVCKGLQSLSHPYIDQILAIHNLETGAYIVRKIYENGSIRDMLYGTNYNKHHLSKYGNPKIRKPLTSGQIAHYGLQILQALKFLRDKDIPHGHVHPGNIVIENQKALLLDVENSIFGAPCLYRPQILELKRINNSEAIDVYCFGRTLYEMAFAAPLGNAICDEFPTEISEDLESVLRLCLSTDSLKQKLPSIEYLLSHPFFTRSRALSNGLATHEDCRIHLKFPLSLKEHLRQATAQMESRLKSDQKLVRDAKREVRIQEILSSEEEMRKQKRRLKKHASEWKSTSSLADARSCSASTASSPTPPHLPERLESESRNGSAAVSSPPPPPGSALGSRSAPAPVGRAALLDAICAFDKSRLSRVQ